MVSRGTGEAAGTRGSSHSTAGQLASTRSTPRYPRNRLAFPNFIPSVALARTGSCHACLGRRKTSREEMEPDRQLPRDMAGPATFASPQPLLEQHELHVSGLMNGGTSALAAGRTICSMFTCNL